MSIASLNTLRRIFGGGEPTEEEKKALAREALLMTLARMTNADSNIAASEVETVRRIFSETTGEEISAGEVRAAARSDLYEATPLPKYLSKISNKLDHDAKVNIACSLASVMKADHKISENEVAFFNEITRSMNLTAADIAGVYSE